MTITLDEAQSVSEHRFSKTGGDWEGVKPEHIIIIVLIKLIFLNTCGSLNVNVL